MKKCFFITVLLILLSNSIYACYCSTLSTISSSYQSADFVATIKILKNYKNTPSNNEYYKADIEILDHYKGKKYKSIYILGSNGGNTSNSCGTFIPEGETRLIFGNPYLNGIAIYLCSSFHKPLQSYYQRDEITKKLNILKKFAKNYTIQLNDDLYPYDFKQTLNKDSSNYFSLIKLKVNKDGNLKTIQFLTEDNKTLKNNYENYFRTIVNFKKRLKRITKETNKNLTFIFEIKPYKK